MLTQFDKAWFHISHEKLAISEAQRETPELLNNSKNNLFSLKITVLLDLAWSKMVGEQFTATLYLNFEC